MFVKAGRKLLFKIIIELFHTIWAFPVRFMSIGIMTASKPVGSTDSLDEFGIFFVGTADNFLIQQVKTVNLVLSEQLGLF